MDEPRSTSRTELIRIGVSLSTEELALAIALMENIDRTLKVIIESQRAAEERWVRRDAARMNRAVDRVGSK